MFISGVIATAGLAGVIALLFLGGLCLLVIDKRADAHRQGH